MLALRCHGVAFARFTVTSTCVPDLPLPIRQLQWGEPFDPATSPEAAAAMSMTVPPGVPASLLADGPVFVCNVPATERKYVGF